MLKHALGSTLLVTASQCFALALGGTQGSVIIGRPLDILVSSSIDANDAAAGLCLEAEVMYGDTRVPASAVTTAIHKVGGDGAGALRVRVNTPVNEPIVTLLLKAGCQSSFRRSYTLLADFEASPTPNAVVDSRDVTAPVSAGRVVPPPAPASSTPKSRPASAQSAGDAVGSGAGPSLQTLPEPGLVAESPVRLAPPAPRPSGVVRLNSKHRPVQQTSTGTVVDAKQAVAAPAGARLKLDPIELPTGTNPAAVATSTTPAPTASDSLEAPATPATSSSPPAPETALEQQMKVLRSEQERLRLAMESVNAQLTQAQQARYSNPVVYGLAAAVVGLLAALLFFLRRGRASAQGPLWWKTAEASAPLAEPVASDSAFTAGPASMPMADEEDSLSGIEAVEAGVSVFQEVPIATVAPDALLDLWQQVDFLVSIGQPFDALRALEAFVQKHPRASEAPYLRWVQLALQQADERALAQAQAAYEHHYHRLLPAAATVASRQQGLEGDSDFVRQLSLAWPKPTAQALIDAALFSQPGAPGNALRERGLRVFDDLVALRRVLQTLAQLPAEPEAVSVAVPVATEEEVSQWLSVGEMEPTSEQVMASEPVPAAAPPSMLDLEFPVKPDAAAAPASESQVDGKTDLPPLDFDFFEWDAKADQGAPASGATDSKPGAA